MSLVCFYCYMVLLYHKLFLYFTVDGYLVSLQLGPFLNKAAIQICTRHSVNICSCGTLGSWLGVFIFSRYCQTVLQGGWIHLLSQRQYNLIEFYPNIPFFMLGSLLMIFFYAGKSFFSAKRVVYIEILFKQTSVTIRLY